MSVINIEVAEREGARLVIGLGGVSGGGKTFTALQLAWGLAGGDASKVGFLDTENRRGRLYADSLKDKEGKVHKFMIGDLVAPFSPERYSQAIQAFVDAGVEVLVIDSVSHEWEGFGGCEDIANAPGPDGRRPKTPRWNTAKAEHKKFMNVLLQSPLHIIACLRAREKVVLQQGAGGKTEFISQGILPIQEKNFTFELTASLMLYSGGKKRDVIKCPAELETIFGKAGEWAEGYISARHGLKLREWVNGGKAVDDTVQRARDALSLACEGGMAALQDAWGKLPKDVRDAIDPKGCPADLKASAEAFDQQRTIASGADPEVDDLNDKILNGGTDGSTTED